MRASSFSVLYFIVIGCLLNIIYLYSKIQPPQASRSLIAPTNYQPQAPIILPSGKKAQWDLVPPQTHWTKSPEWSKYLKKNKFAGYGKYKPDNNYCSKVKHYRKENSVKIGEDGLPIRKHRIIYFDQCFRSLQYRILKEYGNIRTGYRQKKGVQAYNYSVNLFWFTNPLRHTKMKIGTHFVCDGQMYNRIPGFEVLYWKDTIITLLNEYGDYYEDRPQCFYKWSFVPKTFVMYEKNQCKEAMQVLQTAKTDKKIKWMLKIARFSHQGRGITVISPEVAESQLKLYDNGKKCGKVDKMEVMQTYIDNALLIYTRKFDFRVYMFIAHMDPYIVLWNEGYLRLSISDYDPESSQKYGHVTNASVAKKYMQYAKKNNLEYDPEMVKNQTWYYQQFEDYMVAIGKVEPGWMENYAKPKIRKSLLHISRMVYSKLLKHPRLFMLFGLDYLFDEDLNLWLLEVNANPAIDGVTKEKIKLQKDVLTGVFDLEYALYYGADFDKVLENTTFKWILDGRKPAPERYMGLLDADCI